MLYLFLIVLFVAWLGFATYFAWGITKKTGFNHRDNWEYMAAFFLGLAMCLGFIAEKLCYAFDKIVEAVKRLKAGEKK